MQLSEVLKLFDSPLSQEQCWSVCYGTCKALMTKRREDYQRRERIKYILNLDSLILTQRGDIEILQSEPNFQETQNDSELIFAIGNLVCRCLDHGLDEEEICEVRFQDDLAELIGGMVLQSSEFDEGISEPDLGESWESRKFQSSHYRSFQRLSEVTRFCEARLLRRNIEARNKHYSNVSKALYVEASELKAFLGHVLHELDENSASLDETRGPELAKRYVKEWAKLWLRVMDELRKKTKKRRRNLKPEDYQSAPFDIFNMTESNEELRRGNTTKHSDSLPENAEDKIFNFLRTRVSSQEDVRNKSGSTSPVDITIEENKDVRDGAPSAQEVSNEKKKISVEETLSRKISDWDDYSLDETLEEDYLKGYESDDETDEVINKSSTHAPVKLAPLCITVEPEVINETRKTRSSTLCHVLPEITRDAALLPFHKRRHSIGRMSVERSQNISDSLQEIDIDEKDDESEKIGSSLTEIFKIRQEITRSEMELIKDEDVLNLKKCFGCRRTKFSIFQRSRLCTVCNKKYCLKCIKENTNIPSQIVDALPVNIDVTHTAHTSALMSSRHMSKSMFNLGSTAAPGESKNTWLRNRHSNGLKLHMCTECKLFLDCIESEKTKQKWTVRLELDL
ncbi:protein spire homolog 1-like [Hydractinia symbiolongicarpus]|uniref:protein spire homolog 1-like n=1 Tax=Hydractinia symbiolongicarpus TaxID=13093 RepID=UPI00255132AC|nr:protein spire homolog 1-like [Hydractinia symbiolongicarpus]